MWHYGIWISSHLRWCGELTWPSRVMWHMHSPTFNKWQKKKKKKTLHILTHGTMCGCGLTSLVVYINDPIRDIEERNLTIRSEICSMHIRSLGFQDIRECVMLWKLILRSLGCTMRSLTYHSNMLDFEPPPPSWGATTHTLVPWRQGFRHPTRNECMGLVRPNPSPLGRHCETLVIKIYQLECAITTTICATWLPRSNLSTNPHYFESLIPQ